MINIIKMHFFYIILILNTFSDSFFQRNINTPKIITFQKWTNKTPPQVEPLPLMDNTTESIHIKNKYAYHWFVVEESKNIKTKQIYKTTIRGKEYIFWKDSENRFTAMDNNCNHRGADLSKGKIRRNRVVCPYHSAEFNRKGELCKIPGMNIENKSTLAPCFHQDTYPIVEVNGWVYINIVSKRLYEPSSNISSIYIEPESKDPNYHCLYLKNEINAPSRIVSENLLDVIHISYVHMFGNKENPLPLNDPIAFMKRDIPNHYAIHYIYKSGKKSFVKRYFHLADLHIENEFILPHTVVTRVKFVKSVKTIITFSLPKDDNQTTLFMKVYRNFVYYPNASFLGSVYNFFMNRMIMHIVRNTIKEDVRILENIDINKVNGKYNVKYDLFPNMYRKMYDKIYSKNEKIDD
jgi:phenylpropionate dioxygenase-like ring-hydroxylating dioxygenase large terminal subunit